MNVTGLPASALLAAALLAPAAAAHHSHSNLDREDIRRHAGVVTEYDWSVPHVFIRIAAPNPEGTTVEYTIELLHPPGMVERGWSPDTLTPGEHVTWEGSTDRNPGRYFTGLTWLEKADGTRIDYSPTSTEPVEIRPSTDFTGLWKRNSIFGGTYSPPLDWPYTAAGRTLMENFDPGANPQVQCREPGPPRFTLLPYPILITRPDDNTIVLKGELREEPRVIHLNRNEPPGPASRSGHSVGWFEGDELVVETANFLPDEWGTHAGIDSSAQKHLLERFSLGEDGKSLRILMTITDPVYLAEPVIVDYPMLKLADRELVEAPCSLEGASLFLSGYEKEPADE